MYCEHSQEHHETCDWFEIQETRNSGYCLHKGCQFFKSAQRSASKGHDIITNIVLYVDKEEKRLDHRLEAFANIEILRIAG